ncbi:hypothetical protein IMY05_C4590000300 [Salix suchowensis]|nr:hypothetical protein IMY05_C4590000300 [Salix suchowensis]
MPSPYSTPSTFKGPIAPHPTPLPTSSFLTHSKASLNGNTLGAKKLKQPIYNPYDKFTQNDFDAWIGNITGALRRALGEEEMPMPPEQVATTSDREFAASEVAKVNNEIRWRAGFEGGYGGLSHLLRLIWKRKRKLRAGISDDEADEDEVGWAVSIDRWEDTVREAARYRREAIAEEYEDAGEEQEDSGGEYDEERRSEDELEESALRGGPQEIIDVGSDDDDEVNPRSSPIRHPSDSEGEDEEGVEEPAEEYDDEEEGAEEEEQRYPSDARVLIGPPIGHPRLRAFDTALLCQIQNKRTKMRAKNPWRLLNWTMTMTMCSLKAWRTIMMPRVAAHLLGGDIDETPFLTPGVVTPLEANASPYSPPKEVTYNDDKIQEIVPPIWRDSRTQHRPITSRLHPSDIVNGHQHDRRSVDLYLISACPFLTISFTTDELTPQIQPSQDSGEATNIDFNIFPPTSVGTGADSHPYDAQQVLDILSAFVDASNMSTSDMSSDFHQDDEAFVAGLNNSSDNQSPSGAQGLGGQSEGVIDVDIDVVTIPDKDYQTWGTNNGCR